MTKGTDCEPSCLERVLASALLCALSVFIAWGFFAELRPGLVQFSDVTLHLAVLQQLDEVVRSGGSAFDFWFDASPFGYALFRSYQYLPHLIIYGTYRLLGGLINLETLLPCFTLALAAIIPWVFFHAARVLQLSWWAALACAAFSPFLVEQGGYGLGLRNYLWGTHGIIMQLWAVVFLVPAIAYGVAFVRGEKRGGVLAAVTFLAVGSHILSAYIVIGTVVIALCYFSLTRNIDKLTALRRLSLALLTFMLITAHQWVYILADRSVIHRSTLEPEWKFASRGADWVFSNFISGGLFDLGRLPLITGFLLIGLAMVCAAWWAALRWRQSATNADSSAAVISLCLFTWGSLLCGYQVWGWLFENLSFLSAMHLHRFILPLQICGVLLAGYGAGKFLSFFPSPQLRAFLLALALVMPAHGLLRTFNDAHALIARVEAAKVSEPADQEITNRLKALPHAWVHAGMRKSWSHETRIADLAPLYHLLVAEGVPTLGMLFHSMGLAGDLLFEFSPERESDYKLFGVRYSVSPTTWRLPSFLKPLAQIGQMQLSEYPGADALSVEDLAFEGWGNAKDTVRYLQSWVNSELPAQHAFGKITQGLLSKTTLALPFASLSLDVPVQNIAPGRVLGQSQWESQRVSGVVELSREAIVVFRTGYHPGWTAQINGVSQEVFSVTPGFLAVKAGPGVHRISFEYQPSGLRPWFVLMAVLVCVVLVRRDRIAWKPLKETAL